MKNLPGSNRNRVLFITAPIHSHVSPTFYLADMLSENYDIYYTVYSESLADMVKVNGYTSVIDDKFRITKRQEYEYLLASKGKAGFWRVFWSIWTNEIYHHRKKQLLELIKAVNPDVIFIDIFHSADFLVLYGLLPEIKILFYNPMLSTYAGANFPLIPINYSEETELPLSVSATGNLGRTGKFRQVIFDNALRQQWPMLLQETKLSAAHVALRTHFGFLFDNIPEIILAPLELELIPDLISNNQHYMGLCLPGMAKSRDIDGTFDYMWNCVKMAKLNGDKIIYCSFGSFYDGPNTVLVDFLKRLLESISTFNDIQFICSVNTLVIEDVKGLKGISPKVHFFSRVPQLEILELADLHITHGGIGSIKESIHCAVPMLVYPLDLRYDQYGNGFRVEQHGLGLQGVLRDESSALIRDKILNILNNHEFNLSVRRFRDVCNKKYSKYRSEEILSELIESKSEFDGHVN